MSNVPLFALVVHGNSGSRRQICPNSNCTHDGGNPQWLAMDGDNGTTLLHPSIVQPKGKDIYQFPKVPRPYEKTPAGRKKKQLLEAKIAVDLAEGNSRRARYHQETIKLLFERPEIPRGDWKQIEIQATTLIECACGDVVMVKALK